MYPCVCVCTCVCVRVRTHMLVNMRACGSQRLTPGCPSQLPFSLGILLRCDFSLRQAGWLASPQDPVFYYLALGLQVPAVTLAVYVGGRDLSSLPHSHAASSSLPSPSQHACPSFSTDVLVNSLVVSAVITFQFQKLLSG